MFILYSIIEVVYKYIKVSLKSIKRDVVLLNTLLYLLKNEAQLTVSNSNIVCTKEELNKITQLYESFTDEILKGDLSNTESYDKVIMIFFATSLGISLTTIRLIVTLETASYIYLIQFGLLLLLISLIVSIYYFR